MESADRKEPPVDDPDRRPAALDPHTLAVQQLFVQHQPELRAFVLALAPDFATADDALQEAFLAVSLKAGDFQLGSNFQAWARSIVRFKLLSATRDRRRAARRLADDVIEALAADAPDDERDGHEAAIARLRCCLDRLGPMARELVRLRYFGEHLPEAIARMRAQSVNAVSVTLARARAALRGCLERGHGPQDARP
jgi:RNA polymerase sigma-70 factor (ECF subfamily)